MLKQYDEAYRAAAQRIAEADRQTRNEIGVLTGQEENYTVRLSTKIQEQMRGYAEGGISWSVLTYNPPKADESLHGGDILIAVNMNVPGQFSRSKGFLVQAKLNKNVERGLAVKRRPELETQCRKMLQRSRAAFVFAYGQQATRIARARDILAAQTVPLSGIYTDSVAEFFYDVFRCRAGSEALAALDEQELVELAKDMRITRAVLLKARRAEQSTDTVSIRKRRPRPRGMSS